METKERLARDLAETLVDTQKTQVTKQQLAAMKSWDVYEWLEAWGYVYLVGAWESAEED